MYYTYIITQNCLFCIFYSTIAIGKFWYFPLFASIFVQKAQYSENAMHQHRERKYDTLCGIADQNICSVLFYKNYITIRTKNQPFSEHLFWWISYKLLNPLCWSHRGYKQTYRHRGRYNIIEHLYCIISCTYCKPVWCIFCA
nr:MAG TPA: hypothetical protein [Caudoviricetes sp.]